MKFSNLSLLRTLTPVALAIAMSSSPAFAQSVWNNTATDFDNPLDWTPNTAPSATVYAEFNSAFTNQPTLTAASAAQGIWVTGSGPSGVSGLTDISGAFGLTIAGNATLDSIANAGILLDGTGNSSLTIDNTVTGVTTSASTSFLVNNAGTLTIGAPLTITTGTALTLGSTTASGAGSIVLNGITATTGTLTVNDTAGSTAVTLAGTDAATGATTLTSGTLTITGSLTGSSITANGGTLQLNGASAVLKTLTVANANATVTESATNAISGAGVLKITAGNVTLSQANNYTGATTVTGGTLTLSNAAALGTVTGGSALTVGNTGGTVDLVGNSNTTFTDGTTNTVNLLNGGTINVAGTGGAGTTLGFNNSSWTASSGTFTFTNVGGSGYTLSLGAVTNGGVSDIYANNMVNGTLALSSFTYNVAGARTMTFNGTSSTATTTIGGINQTTVAGAQAGAMGLTLSGSGTTVLNGQGNYTGNTAISNGTVKLGNANALGFGGQYVPNASNSIALTSGALDLNGQSGVTGVLTIGGTGINNGGALINNNTTTAASFGGNVALVKLGSTGVAAENGLTPTTIPTVVFAAPASGTTATGTALLGVTAANFTVTTNGTTYTTLPTVTISGGGGTGATATVNASGVITITNAGYGFTSAPSISFSTGVKSFGTGFTATSNGTAFDVGAIQVTNSGSGYTAAPSITFGSGTGTATATASSLTFSAATDVGGAGNTSINAGYSTAGFTTTKVGTGTFAFNGTETGASGIFNAGINAGTLQFGNPGALYGGTQAGGSPNWGPGPINIGSGSTLAFNVGGANDFTATNIGTIITNFAASTATTGLESGASLGLDTTNGNAAISTAITDNNGGLNYLGFVKLGANTLQLSGANTYSNGTTVVAGTLQLSGAGTLGAFSAGNSASATDGALTVGTSATAATVDLNGTSQSVTAFNGTASGSVLNNSGVAGVSTLTVGGNNASSTFNGIISDNNGVLTGGQVGLTKTGTGTQTLTGNSTYTGPTNINGGTLALTTATGNLGGTAVAINTGTLQIGATNSTLAHTIGSGTGGSVTIGTGGVLNLENNAVNSLAINSGASNTGLTLTGGTLNFDLGSTSDSISVTGLANASGTITINVLGLGNLTGTTQTLITAAAGSTLNGATYTLGQTGTLTGGSNLYALSLVDNGTTLSLVETAQAGIPPVAFWTGSQGTSSWSTLNSGNANFSTDITGATNTGGIPGATTAVTFIANGATNFANTTLDGNFTITSLNYNVGGVGIAGGTGGPWTLTLNNGGITVNHGVGASAENISSNVALNSSQAWTVTDANSTLNVSGNITSTTSTTLTTAGSGKVVLSGNNTALQGPIAVTGGTLNLNSANALGVSAGVTVSAGASLQLGSGVGTTTNAVALGLTGSGTGTAGALENVAGSNTYTGLVALNGATSIGSDAGSLALSNTGTITGSGDNLALVGAGNGSIASIIGTGSGTLTMSGTGIWTLSGANTYTGGTTVTSGTLQLTGSGTLGTSTNNVNGGLTVNGGTLDLGGTNQTVGNFTGTGGTIVNNSGSGTSTLTIGANNSTGGNYQGVIANNTTGSGVVALTKIGAGTEEISGQNTFTGTTSVNQGELIYGSVGSLSSSSQVFLGSGANAANLTYAGSGGTFATAINLSNATSTAALTLGNSGTGNITYSTSPIFTGGGNTLTLGNATDVFGGTIGPITDASPLTKNGLTDSTWILTGGAANDLTGKITVSGGVLQTTNSTDLTANLGTTGSITLVGTPTTHAIFQSQGTITTPEGAAAATAGTIFVGNYGGFAAIGGNLTVDLGDTGSGPQQLNWSGNFVSNGTNELEFGSKTANAQVIFENPISLGTAGTGDATSRSINVEKGAGGDSVNITGVISNPTGGTPLASAGITKLGNGTLILSGQNTFSGAVVVSQGTLIAGGNSADSGAVTSVIPTEGAFGTGYGSPTLSAPSTVASIDALTMGTTTTGAAANPSILIGGAYTIGRPINATDSGTGNVYSIGATTDANSYFTGAITFANSSATGNSFAVTQVATTGADALNINGGITGNVGTGATAGAGLFFNNVGSVNVNSVIGGTTSVTQNGTGTTFFNAGMTYTGATTINAGTVILAGNQVGSLNGPATVNLNGTLLGQSFSEVAGILTVNGGKVSTVDGSIGTLFVKSLVLNSGTLSFEISGTPVTNPVSGLPQYLDTIDTTVAGGANGTLTIGSGTTTINILNVGGVGQTLTAGSYALITYAGTQLTSTTGLALGTSTLDGMNLSLSATGANPDTLYLVLTPSGGGGFTATTYTVAASTTATLLHVGATTTVATTITNTGSGTDSVNYTNLTATSSLGNAFTSNGGTVANGGPLAPGATSSPASTQTYHANVAGVDTIGGTAPGSTGANGTGAANQASTGNTTATITVYSGQSTWAGVVSGTGTWGTYATSFGTNWTGNGGSPNGSPGIDSGFTATDTATFATVSEASQTVTLDTAAPSLNSINFSGTTAYTLAQGTGSNSISLNGGTSPANINDSSSATQTISAPVILNTNVVITNTGSKFNISGAVSGPGGLSTAAGSGTTVLGTANTYSGGTTVLAGSTLYADGGVVGSPSTSATGTGTITVSGIFGGSGVIAPALGKGIVLKSGSTLVSGDVQTGTVAGKGLTLDNTVAQSTILNASAGGATLSFSLGAGTITPTKAFDFSNPSTFSTFTNVLGNTAGEIAFATGDTINLTDLTGGTLQLGTPLGEVPYLLIQAGSNLDYSGLVTSGGVSGGMIQNGWVQNLTVTGNVPTNYFSTQLYLYNGDLEVVPEPSTWAMMIGGLALLVFLQRRKNSKV